MTTQQQGDERKVLATTIWAEGRDDGIMAMAALATMAKNRMLYAPHRYGFTWREVCQQMPCWQAETRPMPGGLRWEQALVIAELVMELPMGDVSRGATAFCRASETIGWKGRETARVGGLRFYRELNWEREESAA
jgi:hypothetical protein